MIIYCKDIGLDYEIEKGEKTVKINPNIKEKEKAELESQIEG